MTAAPIPSIDANDLRAEPRIEGGQIALRFAGSADSRSEVAIEELLARVHEQAVHLAVREVSVDLRDCDFVNSSCFKAFVVWLERIQDLAPNEQYKLCFYSDETKAWQRRSLGALSCFAIELVRIETKASGASR
jgi:hypothetical protein